LISQAVSKPCRMAGFGEVIVSPKPDTVSMLDVTTPLMAAKSG